MVREKVTLALTDEALQILDANATERKRGEFVSNVLVEYSRIMSETGARSNKDEGLLERMDNRLARIERQVAVIVANNSR